MSDKKRPKKETTLQPVDYCQVSCSQIPYWRALERGGSDEKLLGIFGWDVCPMTSSCSQTTQTPEPVPFSDPEVSSLFRFKLSDEKRQIRFRKNALVVSLKSILISTFQQPSPGQNSLKRSRSTRPPHNPPEVVPNAEGVKKREPNDILG